MLPAFVLSLPCLASILRVNRAEMIEVLGADYITAARAYGLGAAADRGRLALKNAMLPTLAMIGLRFGWMLGSTVLVETVFDWPGLGLYAVNSAISSDFKPVMGVTLLIGVLFMATNLLVDLPMAGSIRGWRRHEPGAAHRGRADGADAADRFTRADAGADAGTPRSRRRCGCPARGVSRTRLHHILPALAAERGRTRRLLRDLDAGAAECGAVRARPRPRHRTLGRLRGTHAEGRRFNSAILTAPDGSTLLHYRKVHLPGSVEPRPGARFHQLEKRYFAYGDQGFPVARAASLAGAVIGTMICNDRRWPEAWRVLGLGGAELVLLGYNSAAYDPNGGEREDATLRTFHSQLVVQANAYMNATWAVAVAKAGEEDGAGLIGGSCIVDPNGRIVAETRTLADEVIVADCDLDACIQGKTKMFDFAAHRRPQWYGPITGQVGATAPP